MAKLEAARFDGQFIVICDSPDVCKTPPSGTPVPYQIVAFASDTVRQSNNVRFRGKWAKTMDSRISQVTGDEPGAMGGVVSGVCKGFCKPITHSATVRVNGFHILFDKATKMWMNCAGPDGVGNTVGTIYFQGFSTSASLAPDGAPPADPEISVEIPAEQSFIENIVSVDGIASLAQMAPQLATMNWSDPLSALGAFGGLAGVAGFGEIAQAAALASQAAGVIEDPSSLLGLVGPLGKAVGFPGSDLLGLVSTDWSNPGSVIGAGSNLAGITGCFG